MNVIELQTTLRRLTDADLELLLQGYANGYLALPHKSVDDLVGVYAALCLSEGRPAVFVIAGSSPSMVRIFVAVHEPDLLPEVIQAAVEMQVFVRRSCITSVCSQLT